jgi:hypothetical protein
MFDLNPANAIGYSNEARCDGQRFAGGKQNRKMRWLIVEDALVSRKGHWFEAITTFYLGFRRMGDEVVVLADASVEPDIRESLAAVPILPPSIWHRKFERSGRATRYARVFIHPWQTWRTMRRYLKVNQNFDAIIVPTVGLHHLLAWVWLIKRTLRNRPTRVLLFFIMLPANWDPHSGKAVRDGSPTSWLLFRLLRSLGPEIKLGKVLLGAETEVFLRGSSKVVSSDSASTSGL